MNYLTYPALSFQEEKYNTFLYNRYQRKEQVKNMGNAIIRNERGPLIVDSLGDVVTDKV